MTIASLIINRSYSYEVNNNILASYVTKALEEYINYSMRMKSRLVTIDHFVICVTSDIEKWNLLKPKRED